MQYRKDVQTLRGVAVLLVVLFHLDIACFASGFLGVDVFFVISGYLMALMYTPDAKVEFFTKRAKRLLPAYFATVLATVVASLFLTTPNDFSQVSTQAWFAAFFASNIGFWWENSYFDKAAFRPLLHLWSLGVEIQFYLFVPAIAWGAKRTGAAGLALVISISAVACFCVLGISPKTSFFWMPMRLWEFLLGFAVATSRASAPGTRAPHLRWVGGACLLVVLLVPLFPVDGAAMGFVTGHPGLSAMVITVATAAILAVGLPEAIQSSGAGTALARVGDYSYSVYLAHFPVIVLTLYRPFAGTVLKPESMPQLLVAALLVLASSAALFRFVESPLRRTPLLPKWAAGVPLATVVLGSAGSSLQEIASPPAERAVFAAWTDRSAYRCGKMTRILHPAEITCLIGGPASSSHVVMLVGNSHADAIKTVFARVAAANGIAVYFAVENNPLMGGRIDAEHLVWEAAARKADAIVLHYSPGAISPSVVEQVAVLAGQHNVRVLFVMPVPVWKKQVPQMLWAAARYGQPVQHLSIIDYQRANAELARSLATIRSPNFSVYQVADAFCTPDCVLTDEGKPLYFDKEHLTLTGSEKLTGVFSKIMSDILSASSSEHECQQEAPRQPSDARGLAGSPAGACTS